MAIEGLYARGMNTDQTDGLFARGLFLDSESGATPDPLEDATLNMSFKIGYGMGLMILLLAIL